MTNKVYNPVYPGLYYFDTFTFTTLGTTGHRGPEPLQMYANAPWRDGDFSIVDGQQQWTVPANGTYQITAAGAYGAAPGRVVTGQVDLYEGQIISLLVGQQPIPLTPTVLDNLTVGGGGGTFVVSNGKPLIVASGGDGSGGPSHTGDFLPSGDGSGQSGAGYLTNGTQPSDPFFQFLTPIAYVNGGFGNVYNYGTPDVPEEGGFGGGQCPLGLLTQIATIDGDGSTVYVTTTVPHGYPFNYVIVITDTTFFNGAWSIQVTGSDSFAFTYDIVGSETYGFVSGITTGISGGGGYTGSPGDGVSGATCYADPSVVNFTDLGASSNTAGYVTVTLVDPVSIQSTWSWDVESPWKSIKSILPNIYTLTRADGIGLFVAASNFESASYPHLTTSADAKSWTNSLQDFTEMSSCMIPIVSSNDVIVYGNKTSMDGISWQHNNLPISIALPPGFIIIPGNSSIYNHNAVYLNQQFILQLYSDSSSYVRTTLTSSDGLVWNIVTTSTDNITIKTYNDGVYVGLQKDEYYKSYLVYSSDLVIWSLGDATTDVSDVTFGNGVFVAPVLYVSNETNGVFVSNNGINWTFVVIPQEVIELPVISVSICFASGYFIMFGSALQNLPYFRFMMSSPDGQTWTLSKQIVPFDVTKLVLFGISQTLGILSVIPGWGIESSSYITLTGNFIVPGSDNFTKTLIDIAYSPEFKTMVTVDLDNNLYTNTNNGIGPWIFTPTVLWYEQSHLCYSKELGTLFFYNCRQTFGPSARIVQTYSWSGSEWIDHGITYRFESDNYSELYFTKPFWCKETGYFTNGSVISRDGIHWTRMSDSITNVVYAYHDVFVSIGPIFTSPNFLYYSSDGYNWSLASYPHENCQFNGVAWSPQLNVFAGTGVRDGTYFSCISSDGINWTETSSTIGGEYIVWSPELEKFYVFKDNYVSESSDGQNWTSLKQTSTNIYPPSSYSGLTWYSGLDSFVTFHRNQLLFSKKATKTF